MSSIFGNKSLMDQRPDIALVPVEHDLDVTTVPALRAAVDRLIDNGCRRVILNMTGATYVDSAGMALLLVEIRRMRKLGGLLSLVNVSDEVLRILRRARLVDFAPVSGRRKRESVTPLAADALPLWRTAVPIDAHDLAATRAQVSRLLSHSPLSPDEVFDTTLAVGEAMGNAVDHTSGAEALVSVSGYEDRVVVDVCDNGPGFDPRKVSEPCDRYAERGRGIALMRLLADSVSITPRASGEGMLVRIVKIAHAGTD